MVPHVRASLRVNVGLPWLFYPRLCFFHRTLQLPCLRHSTLRHIFIPAASCSQLCHSFFHYRAHVIREPRGLRKHQGCLPSASPKQCHHLCASSQFLREQLYVGEIPFRKHTRNHTRLALPTCLSQQLRRFEFSNLFQQFVLSLRGGLTFFECFSNRRRNIPQSRGKQRSRLDQRLVIRPRRPYRPFPAHEFHSETLLHLLNLAAQDASHLSRRSHMSPATGAKVESLHFNQPQLIPLRRRNLSHAHLAGLLRSHEVHSHRTIFQDHLVRSQLGFPYLFGHKRLIVDIDRATLLAHVEGNRRHLE